MTNSLFIRTYARDLPWLHELFRSIDKFVTGFEIVVQCDTQDRKATDAVVRGRAQVKSRAPYHERGYIGQQLAKICADEYCSGDFITFVDSDCMFIAPTTPDHFFVDGKPQILHTSFKALGNAVPWQAPTERIIGHPVEYEFMRAMRLTYPRDIFGKFRRHVEVQHKVRSAIEWLARQHDMSEFCALGAFCWMFEHDRFSWLNTETEPLPQHNIIQAWSHAGITPEYRAKIESILA